LSNDFFDISGDTIAAAEASAAFRMAVPPTARKEKDGGDAWVEHGTIQKAWSESYTKDIAGTQMAVKAFHIQFQVDERATGLNPGFSFRSTMRVNKDALSKGGMAPKGSPLAKQHTMSRMGVARLKNLFRTVGAEPDLEGGGYSMNFLSVAFPDLTAFPGEPSFLENQTQFVELKQKEAPRRDGQPGTFTQIEITKFLGDEEPA